MKARYYEILTSREEVSEHIIKCLKNTKDSLATWNSDRFTFLATMLYDSLSSSSDVVDKTFLILDSYYDLFMEGTVVKHATDVASLILNCPVKKQFQEAKGTTQLRQVIAILHLHLACSKHISFPADHALQIYTESKNLYYSQLFQSLPELPRFFWSYGGSALKKAAEGTIPDEWNDIWEEVVGNKIQYKSLNGYINNIRRLVIANGLTEASLITTQDFINYLDSETSTADRTYATGIALLNALGSKIDANAVSNRSMQLHTAPSTNKVEISNNINDDKNIPLLPEQHRLHQPEHFIKQTTKFGAYHTRNYCYVTSKKQVESSFEFDGCFFTNEGRTLAYSYEQLLKKNPKNKWLLAQREYIETYQEVGSKNNVIQALSIFNSYLFGYLPSFFNSNNVNFAYPDEPEKFISAIYVKRSAVYNLHHFGEINTILPGSLKDFLKLSMKDLADNTARSRYNHIRKFFEYLIRTYPSIPGFRIDTNPISDQDLKAFIGSKYASTSKETFELEYWMFFGEFLYEIANKLVSDIEHSVSNANVSTKGIFSNISINKVIKWGDDTTEINDVEIAGAFDRISILRAKEQSYLNPVMPLVYLVMAKSGLRLSNVTWLCQSEWDNLVQKESEQNEYVDLIVSTDKAKKKPFGSRLPYKVVCLLRRWITIKEKLWGETAFIPYQNNVSSKWRDIKPIFAIGSKSVVVDSSVSLNAFLREFEKCNTSFNHDSVLFYKPVGVPVNEFHEFVTTNRYEQDNIVSNSTIRAVDSYCLHDEHKGGIFFTPISKSSLFTPHSLRATLDTYLPLIIGAEDTGRLFTGQAESTVHYYCKATPETQKQVKSKTIQLLSDFDLTETVPVKSVVKDTDEIKNKILRTGLVGIDGFTYSSESKEDIEDVLSTVSINDIAVNNTHICIHGNTCPKRIKEALGGIKNCAICPDAVGMKSDYVAISAQIRYHVDNIASLNHRINSEIQQSEREKLILLRKDELLLTASWQLRLKFILSIVDDKDFITLNENGNEIQTKLSAVKPSNTGVNTIARLIETEGIPTLQSETLKVLAERLSRKLLQKISNDDYDIPLYSPVEIAANLIKRVAHTHNLSREEIALLIDSPENDKLSKVAKLEHLIETVS